MLTLFLILAFIFIILIACVPTEKNSKDVAANSYEEWGKRTLLALGIFALIVQNMDNERDYVRLGTVGKLPIQSP